MESILDPRTTPGAWGEFLRLRGELRARQGRASRGVPRHRTELRACSSSSANAIRPPSASSRSAGSPSRAGARSTAERHFQQAAEVFESLGATRDLEEVRARGWPRRSTLGTGEYVGSPADADDALVRRLVDAAILPELLARELTSAFIEAISADVAVVFVELPGGDIRVIAHAAWTPTAPAPSPASACRAARYGTGSVVVETIGREPRRSAVRGRRLSRPLGNHLLRRVRMMTAVARQGFELCGARERPVQAAARQLGTAARAAGAGIRLRAAPR